MALSRGLPLGWAHRPYTSHCLHTLLLLQRTAAMRFGATADQQAVAHKQGRATLTGKKLTVIGPSKCSIGQFYSALTSISSTAIADEDNAQSLRPNAEVPMLLGKSNLIKKRDHHVHVIACFQS